MGSSSSTTETMCVIYDLSYLEMTLDVDELDILDIQVGQKAEITADAIDDCTFEGVVTSISSAGTTTGSTTTYPCHHPHRRHRQPHARHERHRRP